MYVQNICGLKGDTVGTLIGLLLENCEKFFFPYGSGYEVGNEAVNLGYKVLSIVDVVAVAHSEQN